VAFAPRSVGSSGVEGAGGDGVAGGVHHLVSQRRSRSLGKPSFAGRSRKLGRDLGDAAALGLGQEVDCEEGEEKSGDRKDAEGPMVKASQEMREDESDQPIRAPICT